MQLGEQESILKSKQSTSLVIPYAYTTPECQQVNPLLYPPPNTNGETELREVIGPQLCSLLMSGS